METRVAVDKEEEECYPCIKKMHEQGTKHPIILHAARVQGAKVAVQLIPIRIDINIEGGPKLSDKFTWNLNESLLTPEQFSQIFVDDLAIPVESMQLVPIIAAQIRQQCQSYAAAAEMDTIMFIPDESDDDDDEEDVVEINTKSDTTIIIKLELFVGTTTLKDQFEWPLYSTSNPTPEGFARQLCAELGIGGQFAGIISHDIRTQVCLARLSDYHESIRMEDIFQPCRLVSHNKWEPELFETSINDFERIHKERERSSRRMRRSQRISGSSILSNERIAPQTLSLKTDNFDSCAKHKVIAYQHYIPKYQEYDDKTHAASYLRTNRIAEALKIDSGVVMRQVDLMLTNSLKDDTASTIAAAATTIKRKTSDSSHGSLDLSDSQGPKHHRGFGASAKVFNPDGQLEVGDYRKNWRCSWCMLSGKFTPTLRKGPLGSKTLCNACGIWFSKRGSMPQDRFQEHIETL